MIVLVHQAIAAQVTESATAIKFEGRLKKTWVASSPRRPSSARAETRRSRFPSKGSRSTGSSLALTAMERLKELEKSRLETLFNKDRRRVQVLEEVLEATLVRTSMKLRLPWTN